MVTHLFISSQVQWLIRLYLGNCKCRKLIPGRVIGEGLGVQRHGGTLV